MKQLLTVVALLALSHSFAQDITGCEAISLSTESEIKEAEPCIIKLSAYVLTQPMMGSSKQAHYSKKVVYNWIDVTPDYSFSLNNNVMKIFEDNNVLLFNTYISCLANAALTKENDFEEYALELLAIYLREPDNKVDKSKAIEKFLLAWDTKSIKKYLK